VPTRSGDVAALFFWCVWGKRGTMPAKKKSAATSSNPWIAHVQRYRASNSCTYSEALTRARASYYRGPQTYRSAGQEAPPKLLLKLHSAPYICFRRLQI
jgi:hypothetical protein